VSLAATTDFVSFTRLGPAMPPDDKDAAVFPRRFGNRYAMIHRPVSTGSSGAHIWISCSPDLTHWATLYSIFSRENWGSRVRSNVKNARFLVCPN
jgi:predicted GH43/DUF377 family glycosyl hydrolase